MKGALLVAGTTSDAGKSLVTAGLCRWLARKGVAVAPFKAQNMSNNSCVTADGGEIARAQWMQAAAAGVEPEVAMSPVLLKPGSDRSAQVVLMGRAQGEVSALQYAECKPRLLNMALAALADLRSRFDVVICEGAGSPAEVNLRAADVANMGLARAVGLPVIVVGDIDRGGVFASLFGTLALLSPSDQALVTGFVVNKFRGDPALLEPGLGALERLTGRPVMGVLPWLDGVPLDAEDSLQVRDSALVRPSAGEVLRVAVVRLPRMSNFTDVEALGCEPGVLVRYATMPEELADADLVVVPGTRATVSDLSWVRRCGLAAALLRRAARGQPVLGICGGYQMLAGEIVDDVESGAGAVPGLGLLPARVTFRAEKVLRRPVGSAYGHQVAGYEIHHGRVAVDGGEPFLDGCRAGAVWGTTWHGAFENDAFRRAFLADVAEQAGRRWQPAGEVSFARAREARFDAVADVLEQGCDTDALGRIIEHGAPPGLPFVPPGAPL